MFCQLSKSDCGNTKACFSKPESCSSSNDCSYLLMYKPSESAVTFEMSSKEEWVSVGFNKDPIMVIYDNLSQSFIEMFDCYCSYDLYIQGNYSNLR